MLSRGRQLKLSVLVAEAQHKYDDHPLVQSMLCYEKMRTAYLEEDGKNQIFYPKSNAGWMATIFIIRGRALDSMLCPWILVTLHAVAYTVVQEVAWEHERDMEPWEIFFSFCLNSTLSFLLVFRLNRAASRFWSARQYWGDIVARSRSLAGGIIVHGDHNPRHRDEAIRWICVFAVATMELLRGTKELPLGIFAGVLAKEAVLRIQDQRHPPMYAADRVRFHLKQLFLVDADVSPSLAIAWSTQLQHLEDQVNSMIWSGGGMERIKATPLPIVYVSHLRTFILINLILFPWVFGPSWGWSTIPIVAAAAFAWLGIDATAVEVESPFSIHRVNALNMDAYVIGLLDTILQQIQNHADMELEKKNMSANGESSVVSG